MSDKPSFFAELSETEMEGVMERYGVDDLNHVISALELLTPKFQKAHLRTL
jgi:hypothetical protein